MHVAIKSFLCSVLFLLSGVILCAQAQNTQYAKCDYDSLGDLWIFTLDKTGSMLAETTISQQIIHWSPAQIKADVMSKLSKDGSILDQIDYSRDHISIMQTGYGTRPQDSNGNEFRSAQSLDYSFIHPVSPLQKYSTLRKKGLESVLEKLLEENNYEYRESFVSQIRVLSLHRLLTSIQQSPLDYSFKKIHIVTITDDADANDQWRMDYFTIRRAPAKMRELNRLHAKYVYSTFTQRGGGYLDECEKFTDISSKNHIYMYNYITRQQIASDLSCSNDSLISFTPLDGKIITMRCARNQISADSLCFMYIDSIYINQLSYPVHRYMSDSLCLKDHYEMNTFRNDIAVCGKIQVQYQDSIYGAHYKNFKFIQKSTSYTAFAYELKYVVIKAVVILLVGWLIFVLLILPNRKIMTISLSDGRMLRIRRGYKRQWEKLIPLFFSNKYYAIFAKHPCFKVSGSASGSNNLGNLIVIDSPAHLVFTQNVFSESTKHNIARNAENSYNGIPKAVIDLYKNTLAGHIASLQDSNSHWVRTKLYPALNRWLFSICPHYYYWNDKFSGTVSTTRFNDHLFLLDFDQKMNKTTIDDQWLSTYYEGKYPVSEVLICLNRIDNGAYWDVYQLCSKQYSGYGISCVKHLIHYRQEKFQNKEVRAIRKRLERTIKQEMRVKSVTFLDTIKYDNLIHFNVTQATFMAYICLVEHTVKEKCQILYSPLTDSDSTEKIVMTDSSAVSRLLWTSLVPFLDKNDRVADDISVCESLDIIRDGISSPKKLSIKNDTITFDRISITAKRTK